MFDIKRELTENEFKDIIVACQTAMSKNKELKAVVDICAEKTKEITPAEEVYLLLLDKENNIFEIASHNKSIPIHEEGGVISESLNSRQPFIINDVANSFLYQEEADNIFDYPLKDLMIIPFVESKADQNIVALLWAGIPEKSWNQYTQKDLDYMVRFTLYMKKFLPQSPSPVKKKSDVSIPDCMVIHEKMSAQIRREQEYFANIIHDVRTPMNGVLGFLELLKLDESDPKKIDYIESALKSGESMVALINDALDVSKLSSGKMSIEKVPFNLLDEFNDTARLFYNSARKKEIELHVFYDPSIPSTILSDYHRIKQIINNLLNNAIKFTPNRGYIDFEMVYDKKKDGLTVSVSDSGIGIEKKRQKHIFSPYTQEKSSTSREYGGTGLGLSISQQLAILLGGKLELESEKGKGSKFYFTVPCHTEPDTPAALNTDKLKNLSAVFYQYDKSVKTMAIMKRYFETFGLHISVKENEIPLEQLRDKVFDILIILKEDTVSQEEYIQLMLDSGKSVVILEKNVFEEEHNWFVGKIGRIAPPFLPRDVLNLLLSFFNTHAEQKDTVVKEMNLTGKQVLVVDDNSINLKFMKEILKIYHLESDLAHNGDEALEKFKDKDFDLIFMDENMPGMQGDEVIEKMRRIEKKKKKHVASIIGLTGDAGQEIRDKLLKSGADGILTKPVQLQAVTEVIRKYLQ